MLTTKSDQKFYLKWEWRVWLADPALRKCSFGAKGLWIEVLNLMCEMTPRGVIGGRLPDLAKMLGSTVGTIRPLITELERASVFSRGRDVDGRLPEDSIVNRRLYREWTVSEKRREAGKKGGKAQSTFKQTPSKTQAKISFGNQGGEMAYDRKRGSKTQANVKHASYLSNDYPLESESKSESSTVPVEHARGRGMLNSVHSVLSELHTLSETGDDGKPSPVGLQRIVTKIISLTGDASSEASWRKFGMAFSRDGELFGHFLGEICDFEDSLGRSEVRNKGAVLTTRLQAAAGRLGVAI